MANDIKFVVLGDTKNLEKNLASSSKKFKAMGKSLTTFVTLPLLALGVSFVKIASDAEETANKFDVVFASMKRSAQEWAEDFGNSVGRATEDIQRFTSGLGDVLKPLGFTTEEAFELSSKMTQLALDVASFNNRQDADVIRAFTSALTGERESLKTLGIVINEADVKQEAYTAGIAQTGQALTKTQKAQATINLLYKNTADAQGDLLRTQESFANQLKRLQASLKELGTSLGKILLPAATKLVSSLTELTEKFNALDVGTQKFILGLGGIAIIAGPLLLAIAAITFSASQLVVFFGAISAISLVALTASAGFLAANVGLVAISLSSVAALGAAAFAGWNLANTIAEMEIVKKLFDDIAFRLDLFGVKSNQAKAIEEKRLNDLAVARANAVRAENADRMEALAEQEQDQLAHEAKIRALKKSTSDFIKNNEDELKAISAATTQAELDDVFEKLKLEHNAKINFLELEKQLKEEAGILDIERARMINEEITAENNRFRELEAQKNNEQIQERLAAEQGFMSGVKEGLAGIRAKVTDLNAVGKDFILTLHSGMTKAFEGIISGSVSAKDAFTQFGKTMVSWVIKYAAEWLAFQVLSKTSISASTALGIASGVALAAAYAPAAVAASIATAGGAAVAGAVANTAAAISFVTNLAFVKAAGASLAVGTPNVKQDMVADIHKGETIIPETFASAIRTGGMTLSGPDGGEGGGGIIFDFTGAEFNGVSESFVEDMFTKASEMITNRTLIFRSA